SILIGGRESGRHSVQVEAEGEHCIATTRSSAELRMLVVPVFRYEHVCREIWHERRLVGFESRTEENGRSCWAAGRSTPSSFAEIGAGRFVLVTAGVAPATY